MKNDSKQNYLSQPKNSKFAEALRKYVPELYFIDMNIPYTIIPPNSNKSDS